MSCVDFKYSLHHGNEVPYIPIEINNGNKWYSVWAFVDSGATYSVFEATDAKRLGIDLFKGKKRMVKVGDGSFIPIYLHKILMRIGREEFIAEISFSEQLGVGFNLLGRKDIFEFFQVCFSDKKKVVSFSKEI